MLRSLSKPTQKDPEPQRLLEPQKVISQEAEKQQEKIKLPSFDPRNISKDRLYVTFSGLIEHGQATEQEELSVMFKIWAGEDWKLANGQDSGLSQVGSCYSSSNKKINWNMPFEVTFETTVITGWPQIVLELHGRDFFGRNVIKAYGCCHLPSSEGKHERTVGLFLPKPISVITGFFGYLNGCVAQFKDAQKVLATGDGREVTRVRTAGTAKIKVETVKYNFNLFGYS